MKTNEVITEGSLESIKGAWQGATTGWTAGRAASKFQKEVDSVAKDAYADWAGVLSTISPRATPDQIEQQLINWSNTKFKDKVPGPSTIAPPQLQTAKDTRNMYNYIRARSEEYWRARAGQGPETIDRTGIRGRIEPSIPQDTAPPAEKPAAPTAPKPQYRSPDEVVNALMKTMPADWLPAITAKLLSQQRVQAKPK